MPNNKWEDVLAVSIAAVLKRRVPGVFVETKHNLHYSSIIHDQNGTAVLDTDSDGVAVRRGAAYQQDILCYDKLEIGDVRRIPRVAIELKAGGVTTHDALVYAEKARQLRTMYPYLRFLFVIASNDPHVPVRVLKAGSAFDAIMAIQPMSSWQEIEERDLRRLARVVRDEVKASRALADTLFRRARPTLVWRRLDVE